MANWGSALCALFHVTHAASRSTSNVWGTFPRRLTYTTDEADDRERYQTVFAKQPGAIAAPTAGLHFTPEILDKIRARGAEICELTLEVGLGTFQPVHTETLEDHVMHSESYEIPEQTVQRITGARAAGRPILAVGTTVVRALEAAALRATESCFR